MVTNNHNPEVLLFLVVQLPEVLLFLVVLPFLVFWIPEVLLFLVVQLAEFLLFIVVQLFMKQIMFFGKINLK